MRSTALRRLGFAGTLLILAAVPGCGASGAQATGGASQVLHAEGLRWPPPNLVDPTTIKLPSSGYTETQLDPARDYVIDLPAGAKRGGVTLVGGHNIVIVGGEITVPKTAQSEDKFRRALYIKDATGTVHVEGVLLDAPPEVAWDGIDISAPRATVQIENVKVNNVRGSAGGFHGDVVQPWGGVRELRIDRLSATSDYQGLTIPIDQGPIKAAKISRVDLHRIIGDRRRGRLLWLTTGSDTCDTYPIQLTNVFIETRPVDDGLGGTTWPGSGRPADCAVKTKSGIATWPALLQITGFVTAGLPTAGAYVPPGFAGTDYAPWATVSAKSKASPRSG